MVWRYLENRRDFPRSISRRAFLAGVLVITMAVYAQYLIDLGTITDFLVVYGIPLIVISVLWGPSILQNAFRSTVDGLKYGLGFYGVFTLLGIAVGVIIFYLLSTFDPTAINLLNRPNPLLQISEEYALIMVAVSFVVIGPAEEYLFRGFVYGGLLSLFQGRHWFGLAFISSLFFAGMHLYYASVYGLASLIMFVDLITFGMAMAVTYYISGGNLVAPALIHGGYDAIGFLGIATSDTVSIVLREFMLVIGILAGFIILFKKNRHVTPMESLSSLFPNREKR